MYKSRIDEKVMYAARQEGGEGGEGENYDARKLYVRVLSWTGRYNEKSDSTRKLRPAREREIETSFPS